MTPNNGLSNRRRKYQIRDESKTIVDGVGSEQMTAARKHGRTTQFHRWLATIAIAVMGCHVAVAAQEQVRHRLNVSRFVSVEITEERVDRILERMGQILQTDDDESGPNDVECDVEFERAGRIRAFVSRSGVFSPGDFEALNDRPGMKVIQLIRWCKETARIGFTFYGCSNQPGTHMVVVDLASVPFAATVWAHEFGHSKGLSDRVNEPKMVMSTPAAVENVRVDANECRRFRDE